MHVVKRESEKRNGIRKREGKKSSKEKKSETKNKTKSKRKQSLSLKVFNACGTLEPQFFFFF